MSQNFFQSDIFYSLHAKCQTLYLLVEKLGKVGKRETGSLPDEIFGYKEAKANGDRYYIAATFHRGALNGPKDFVLGDGKTYEGYLNAPLEPETKYKVYVRGATEVNG